jgi:hypothetical protein
MADDNHSIAAICETALHSTKLVLLVHGRPEEAPPAQETLHRVQLETLEPRL